MIGDQLVAVVGATVDQALDPSETLGDNPELRGRGRRRSATICAPALFVDSLPELFQVAELGADGDVDYERGRARTSTPSRLLVAGELEVEDGLDALGRGSPSRSPTSSVPGAMSARPGSAST